MSRRIICTFTETLKCDFGVGCATNSSPQGEAPKSSTEMNNSDTDVKARSVEPGWGWVVRTGKPQGRSRAVWAVRSENFVLLSLKFPGSLSWPLALAAGSESGGPQTQLRLPLHSVVPIEGPQVQSSPGVDFGPCH